MKIRSVQLLGFILALMAGTVVFADVHGFNDKTPGSVLNLDNIQV